MSCLVLYSAFTASIILKDTVWQTDTIKTMSTSSPLFSAAYQACLNEAFTQCPLIMKRWCSGLIEILYDRSMSGVAGYEKHILHDAAAALKTHQTVIAEGFAPELTKAVSQATNQATKIGPSRKDEGIQNSFASLRFDQLELMGDDQVQDTLDSARLEQSLMQAADADLAEFSVRLSTAQGYRTVQVDKNPLHPDVFSQALLKLLRRLPVDNNLRSRWLTHGAQLLGKELKTLYVLLGNLLEQQGVEQAPYRMLPGVDDSSRVSVSNSARMDAAHNPYPQADYPSPNGPGGYVVQGGYPALSGQGQLQGSPGQAYSEGSAHVSREQLLTLDHLHHLMAGDYDDPSEDESSGAASYGAAGMHNDFSHTLPAAMDALAELEQEGLVIASRNKARTMPPLPIALLREQLKTQARTMGQALSIEVVGLMIEKLTSDERLLAPVRQLIAEAEPAFLHLGITDPRFFSDKAHPARRLLEAITAKSLAFPEEDTPGFEQFMQDIRAVSDVLKEGYRNGTQDFAAVLADFEETQYQQTRAASAAQSAAVQALLQAEQRNLLAEKIAQEIRMRPDFISGNGVIASFLTGPWAHVMANERLLGEHAGMGSAKAVYSLTLGDLLWSLDIAQASRHRKRLIKIIPGMLNSVREGLLSIDYPLEQSKAFYDALMFSHEAAIKSVADTDRPDNSPNNALNSYEALEKAFETGDCNNSQTNEPWLAPREAQQSGFMEDWKADTTDFQATAPFQHPPMLDAQAGLGGMTTDEAAPLPSDSRVELLLGAWVELLSDGQWLRAQLTWISPHNTLFMFTSGGRQSHSMTSRMLQQLLASNRLKVFSDQGVLDGALDSVARTAMRNSVDIALDS